MGVWGTGLMQNDTSCDAEVIFKKHIEEGKTPKQAVKLTLDVWKSIDFRRDKYTQTDIYIGLAVTQLELGCLQEDVREKTIKLIDKGATLKGWFDRKDAVERKKILEEFKQKLIDLRPQST